IHDDGDVDGKALGIERARQGLIGVPGLQQFEQCVQPTMVTKLGESAWRKPILCVAKYLTKYAMPLSMNPWLRLDLFAKARRHRWQCIRTRSTTCAISARPWSARDRSRRCQAGAASPWGSRRW